ncbi:nucleotidyltransferase family protein [Sedimentisphaera salicampi]|mgnify:CR=1 FL=1|uniref:Nucleotidyltransferase domain protein n=1 Tax=Sedimentisphaera salicampi TaxID=1941349 RepID=A0A1W6LMG7_9BACT|nr:nucleotidyltransferase family protein [Sedimentisphaera salicampi]ARN56946.1 Nucleotidyltransferase domain protein [Sedimentisphaera salicampi]OXU15089.1 Nucleotidyltransferase domain protein [Sedimentisphaera salicampi]
MNAKIEIPYKRIAEFCKENRIKKLALFGSVLRDDFSNSSDIDILAEFEQGARVGLDFFRIQNELSEIFGRKVDLNTKAFLSKNFREQVINNSEVIYGAA